MAIDRVKVQKQADSYMANGKVDKAIDEFKKLLEDKPDDFNLMNRLGDACLQIQRKSEAMELFRRAGLGFERQGFTNKAAAVYKKAHRAAPDDADVATRLAECYRGANMIKDAIQVHVEMADHFTKKGMLKRALDEFAQVVDLDPKNLKNKIKLADLYNKEGMKDKAADIYMEVAESLAFDQMHGEATQVLERAKAMTNVPKVFLTQSRLAIVQKDLSTAARNLREGLLLNPGSSELLEALAEVEIQAKAPERALEALGKIPQLPEKTALLCERALRDMVKVGRAEEGLNIFKSIGKEFARRGMWEQASRIINGAFQGEPAPLEAWLQLADFASQSENVQARIDALSHAHAHAVSAKDGTLQRHIEQMLSELGISPDQIQVPTQTESITLGETPDLEIGERTEIDPIKRIELQKLEREADNLLKSRFSDKAQEIYQRILELDPTHRIAINRIAEILKSSGVLTKVQQHYVKVGERLSNVGKKHMAVEMLDMADALFPGSTRLQRRMWGLMDLPAAPQQAGTATGSPGTLHPMQPPPQPGVQLGGPGGGYQALPSQREKGPIPVQIPPIPQITAPVFTNQSGEPITESILEEIPAMDELEEAAIGLSGQGSQETPSMPSHLILNPPQPQPSHLEEEAEGAEELDTLEELNSLPGRPPVMEALPPLELEPLPFAAGKIQKPPPAAMPGVRDTGFQTGPTFQAKQVQPVAPPAFQAPVPPPVPIQAAIPSTPAEDELTTILSDIDFQLDYGSPEDARNEINNALRRWPDHPELLGRLEHAEGSLKRFGHRETPTSLAEDHDFTQSFFDLTDVLGSSIMVGEGEEMHDATNVVEKIHTVDELFNAFREGVEQQVKGDDYETHYNLGIAYKEMLLIEPAIEEFKKAMRDPERTLECCSMLSICEQEQGNLQAAEAWLRQGINTPGFPPEDGIGLRYDLGVILLDMNRKEEAQQWFQSVYAMDPDYREVANKV